MGHDQIEQSRVLADGEILTALKSACHAEEFSATHIAAGERLFVYAHSLVDGARQRTQHAGLKKLQQLLAHPASEPAAVTVLGMVTPSAYGRFSYLFEDGSPLRYRELPTVFPLEDQDIAEPAAWHELAKKASEEELEIRCSTFRHSLQSVMAATRIFLGAAIAGHINASRPEFRRTLAELQEKVGLAGGPAAPALEEVVDACINHQKRFNQDYADIYVPSEIDLWVLDDHWVDHGWEMVFGSLPFNSVRGFTDWDELEKLILEDGDRPSVLMIDCNLGPGEDTPTGLELLRSIRSRWQEVKVVFATAFDDAALALTSLREGANTFFAKALNDTEDRRSLDYYRQLMNLLEPHEIEKRVSTLWRTFSIKNTLKNSTTSEPDLQPPATLDLMLRLGFFLLFSLIDDDNRQWRSKRLAVRKTHLYRSVVNLVSSGYPALRDSDKAGLKPTLREMMNKAAHGGYISFDQLCLLLNGVFQTLENKNSQPIIQPWKRGQQPSFWPYSVEDLKTDSSHPGLPSDSAVMQHHTADGQGAIELMRGICGDEQCERNHAAVTMDEIPGAHSAGSPQRFYYDVMLIDDAGEDTGWFNAFQSAFPNSWVFTNVRDSLKHARKRARTQKARIDLIVLDLKLPSFEAGHEALEEILKWDPSVPVITTSASWHSLEAIRSLRKGAIDFVSKSQPHPRELAACIRFANDYKSKCDLLVEYGKSVCRQRWQQLNALRNDTNRDPLKVSEAQRKVAICEKHQSEQRVPGAWQVPPRVEQWNGLIADAIAAPLRLRQQMFFSARRDLGLSLDNWRREHVLDSANDAEMAKLVAILTGTIVERLAMWQWCLRKGEALESRRWGQSKSTRSGRLSIRIDQEIKSLGKFDALTTWQRRNQALHPEIPQPLWNAELCDHLIGLVFEAVAHFGKGTMYN
jgi:DNA-binding NarL/FixJ family response regulator